jgi:hypothetical protein
VCEWVCVRACAVQVWYSLLFTNEGRFFKCSQQLQKDGQRNMLCQMQYKPLHRNGIRRRGSYRMEWWVTWVTSRLSWLLPLPYSQWSAIWDRGNSFVRVLCEVRNEAEDWPEHREYTYSSQTTTKLHYYSWVSLQYKDNNDDMGWEVVWQQ